MYSLILKSPSSMNSCIESRKKMIAERMKGMFEKTYILTFNNSESIYKEEEKFMFIECIKN